MLPTLPLDAYSSGIYTCVLLNLGARRRLQQIPQAHFLWNKICKHDFCNFMYRFLRVIFFLHNQIWFILVIIINNKVFLSINMHRYFVSEIFSKGLFNFSPKIGI